MRFSADHTFLGLSVADFEALFFDESFNEALCRAVRIDRLLQRREVTGERLVREVLVYPERTVPAPLQKVLGGERVGYVERIDYELGSGRGTFVCTPTLLAERVTTQGTLAFLSRTGGVARIVTGEVNVKVFGVGGLIERFIVGDVEASYAAAAAFTADYLRQRAQPAPRA